MNYRYYIPDDGETIDDAVPVTHQMWDGSEFVETDDFSEWVDVEDAAEHAAEECQRGSEWHDGCRTFAIVDENNVVTMVSVEIEYRPTFSGRVVEQE